MSAALLSHPFELRTARLILRAPAEAHAEALNAAVRESIADLAPWMPWADHVPSLEETTTQCRVAEADFRAGRDFRVHLFTADGARIVGGTGVHRVRPEVPGCEIGYWVRSGESGKGYVTEAVRALVDLLWETSPVRRIEMRMHSANVRSRAVPERLGFDLEGVLRADSRHVDGTLRDTCVYARVRGESPRSRAVGPGLQGVSS